MKLTITGFLFLINTITGFSRETINLSGNVTDTAGTPVFWASVALMNAADSSIIDGTVTDTAGNFLIADIDPGTYLLQVSMVGYVKQFMNIDLSNAASSHIGNIVLPADENLLESVEVLALRPSISNNGDKLIMNIENSVLSTGGDALDVLKRTPGITIDNENNIVVKGKQGVMIMVNDKMIYLAGDQLESYLKNLPADQISQIEVITNPSAKYDAEGNAGIINIVLKKNKLEGVNGNVKGAVSKAKQWSYSGGGNLNYMNKGLNISTGYNYRNPTYVEAIDINRNIAFDGGLTQIDEHGEITNQGPNNSAQISIDYDINEKHTIGIAANGFLNTDEGISVTEALLTDENDAFILGTNTESVTEGKYRNYALNGYYHLSIDTLGKELSATADYAYYDGQSLSNFNTYYLNAGGNETGESLLIENDNPTSVSIRSAKIDYTHPLKNNAVFDIGFKSSLVLTDNEIISSYNEGDGWNLDTGQSNHFEYSEQINAGYINFSKQFEKIQVSGGLRVEQTISEGNSVTLDNIVDRNYFDFFPSFSINDMLSENHMLGLTYSKRINRPSYQDLNPFIYYLDPYVFVQGNPYLLPEITHSFELSYTFKQQYMASLSYSNTSDFIINLLYQNDTTNTTYQTIGNLDQYEIYALTLYAPVDVAKWLNITPTVTLYKLYQNTMYEGTQFKTDVLSFNSNVSANFRLPADFTIEATGYYENAGYWGIVKYESMWSLDLGIKKSMFDGNAIIALSASDIFDTYNFQGSFDVNNIDAYVFNDSDSRRVKLSVQYNFGNLQQQAKRHSSGSEEEMNRVKMGN